MAPLSQYATVDQFKARIGSLRLANMSQVDTSEQEADWNLLLAAASSTINDHLSRARYSTPIDPDEIADAVLRAQAVARLAVICCTLAAWPMMAAIPDAPKGLLSVKSDVDRWLAGLISGEVKIAGLAQLNEAIDDRASGRIGGVVGCDDNLSPDLFHRWRNMESGGGFL